MSCIENATPAYARRVWKYAVTVKIALERKSHAIDTAALGS